MTNNPTSGGLLGTENTASLHMQLGRLKVCNPERGFLKQKGLTTYKAERWHLNIKDL